MPKSQEVLQMDMDTTVMASTKSMLSQGVRVVFSKSTTSKAKR